MEPYYAGVGWCQQKETYGEGSPHTAPATYHYMATYTLWLLITAVAVAPSRAIAPLVGDYLGLLYLHILSAKHVFQMLVIHLVGTSYIAVRGIGG